MALLDRLKHSFVDFFFPPQCVGCRSWGSLLCPSCLKTLPWLPSPFCPRCGLPLSPGQPCPDCPGTPWAIDAIRSLFIMEGTAREAVHALKYHGLRSLAAPLGQLLREYLQSRPLPAEVLVPVPLHPRRERWRGFNQAALLAREVGKLSRWPVVEGSLLRYRDSPPQVHARAQERRRNVQGAFRLSDMSLVGKRVLLIDDVCTTGATLDACARTLKDGGALSVWGLTLAREPMSGVATRGRRA